MPKSKYFLLYKQSVDKDLRKLPRQIRAQIVCKIQSLATEPRPQTSTKLRGSTDLYRLRHADYRIIYQIENNRLVILIIKIGHRRDVYRKF